jgi:GAF domain-containing protein
MHTGPLSDGLISQALRTSNVLTSGNLQNDERLRILHAQLHKHGFYSSAVVPFRLKGKAIGVLLLLSQESGLFKDVEELSLLDEMGLDISFALDTMETEAEHRQAARQIEHQNQRLKVLREIDAAILAADSLEDIVGAAPESRP